MDANEMSLQDLIAEFRQIKAMLSERWPIENHEQRVLARTLKMMEELGELSDEILSSMKLQRASRVNEFSQEHLEEEFADVLSCVMLLGIELDIDIEKVIKQKIGFTRNRIVDEMTSSNA